MRFTLILAVLAAPACAHERIASLYYSATQVMPIAGSLGTQTMLEFGDDEHIENIALGDSALWQITPNKRANLIFLKPLSAHAHTNMTVITDRRRYLFSLSTHGRTYYAIKFIYPEAFKLPSEPVITAPNGPPPVIDSAWDRRGDAQLLPERVYDDGRFTTLQWRDGIDLPAIFSMAADGTEGPVNFTMRDGAVVIDGVAPRYVLRIGKAKAELIHGGGHEKEAKR